MYYIKVNNLSYCIMQIKNLIYMNLFDILYNICLNIVQKYFRKKRFQIILCGLVLMKYYGKDMDNKKQIVICRIIENIIYVNVYIYKYIKIKVRYDIIFLNFILFF